MEGSNISLTIIDTFSTDDIPESTSMDSIARTFPSWNPEIHSSPGLHNSENSQHISPGTITETSTNKEEGEIRSPTTLTLNRDVYPSHKLTSDVCQLVPNQDKESFKKELNMATVSASFLESSSEPTSEKPLASGLSGQELTLRPDSGSKIEKFFTLESVVQQLVWTLRGRYSGSGQDATNHHVVSDTEKEFLGANDRQKGPTTNRLCSTTEGIMSSEQESVFSDDKMEEESNTFSRNPVNDQWSEQQDDCAIAEGPVKELNSARFERQAAPSTASISCAVGTNEEARKIHKCPECDKYFPRLNSLKRHIALHLDERPYQCSKCDANYKSSSQLNRHMRGHTGEKPAKCVHCEKSFRTYNALYIHRRKHTGEKPYKCRYCDKCFSSRGYRNTHERIHTGEKRYECEFCGMRFTESSARRVHRFIHTGEAPYKCKECDKSFTQAGNLGKHTRTVHAKEKLFKCKDCTKSFGIKQELERHFARVHSTETPHECMVCGKRYAILSDLTYHKRTHRLQCDSCDLKMKDSAALNRHKLDCSSRMEHEKKLISGNKTRVEGNGK